MLAPAGPGLAVCSQPRTLDPVVGERLSQHPNNFSLGSKITGRVSHSGCVDSLWVSQRRLHDLNSGQTSQTQGKCIAVTTTEEPISCSIPTLVENMCVENFYQIVAGELKAVDSKDLKTRRHHLIKGRI